MTDQTPRTLHTSNAWDRQLNRIGGHLLQSWRWGEFQQRHGWTARRIQISDSAGTAMAQVLYRFHGPLSVAYIPRGPAIFGDPEVMWPMLLERVDALARSNRTIMTLIEPNDTSAMTGTLADLGAVRRADRGQSGPRVRIPLVDDETILERMRQETRHNLDLAQRRGVKIERHPAGQLAIEALYRLMEETARRNGFGLQPLAYYEDFLQLFGDDAVLLFAKADDGALAAALVTARFGNEAISMFGGSSAQDDGHRAAVPLQFEAMRWAREMGCGTYDLRGILNREPEHGCTEDGRWLSWFKSGFGGEIVTYPVTIERRHVPVLPWLARTLNRSER
ncbi:MAG: peptidoglycan bridge formation glycyltransferase FemA/FemB family protein [Chloroflexia bacterium]|nr:peptidoglycan bridge formation glycyltransferase FemA/FemB family protein [Chloroflexia bacterium]